MREKQPGLLPFPFLGVLVTPTPHCWPGRDPRLLGGDLGPSPACSSPCPGSPPRWAGVTPHPRAPLTVPSDPRRPSSSRAQMLTMWTLRSSAGRVEYLSWTLMAPLGVPGAPRGPSSARSAAWASASAGETAAGLARRGPGLLPQPSAGRGHRLLLPAARPPCSRPTHVSAGPGALGVGNWGCRWCLPGATW